MEHPVLFFDGHCLLCQRFVQWILRHDPKGIFHFSSQQSEYAGQVFTQHALTPNKMIYLIDNGHIFAKFEVIIQIGKHLGFPWSLISIAKILPRFLQNRLYDIIAENRYHWFGKSETCYLPRPEWKERFVE